MKRYFSISFMVILLLFVAITYAEKGNTAPAPKYFAYVANSGGDNNISAYSIDPTTGALTEIKGSPFPAGIDPISMAVHPNGKYIYVANHQSYNISAYNINPTTGALTVIKGSPYSTKSPVSVTIAPSGKFVYATNLDGDVSIYAVNHLTGALTAIKDSPFHIQKKITGIVFDPTGKLALTTDYSRNSIISYSINDETGRLTRIKETAIKSGKNPNSITIDPTSQFALVSNYDSENLSVYSINNKKRTLNEIKGSPFKVGKAYPVIFTHSGKFVYILSINNIEVYSFNQTTGRLTTIKDGSYYFSDNEWITSIAVDPSHKFLYATNSKINLVPNSFNAIYVFSINPTTGELTEILESTVDAGDYPGPIVVVEK